MDVVAEDAVLNRHSVEVFTRRRATGEAPIGDPEPHVRLGPGGFDDPRFRVLRITQLDYVLAATLIFSREFSAELAVFISPFAEAALSSSSSFCPLSLRGIVTWACSSLSSNVVGG
ncbi:MAG TPA: hypothetical protein VGO11_04045 [Chthoniobacteraceae bacterium]|jgi:hypothetical protein|nr:hypothetical protein [Chthoniobacteraceae bacterium]